MILAFLKVFLRSKVSVKAEDFCIYSKTTHHLETEIALP